MNRALVAQKMGKMLTNFELQLYASKNVTRKAVYITLYAMYVKTVVSM